MRTDFTGHFDLNIDRVCCPLCGSTLLVNRSGQAWCSFVGGREEKACRWGLYENKTVEDAKKEKQEPRR